MRTLAALALIAAAAVCAAQPGDEVFSENELLAGKSIDRAACAGMPHAVWVEHAHGTECIRYYASRGLQGARIAVFYFHGDVTDGQRVVNYRSASLAAQLRIAASYARRFGVPFVLVARPGAYGSSGSHAARRRPKEFHSLNAALDAIRARHEIEQVALAGQSGGATSVGALLTLGRTDVSCAAGASGGYAVLELAAQRRLSARYADAYDVIQHTGSIRPDPRRRIFIIGDPLDKQTLFPQQREFAERIARAGHQVTLIESRGRGNRQHGLREEGLIAASLCAKGAPTDSILEAINKYVSGQHPEKPEP